MLLLSRFISVAEKVLRANAPLTLLLFESVSFFTMYTGTLPVQKKSLFAIKCGKLVSAKMSSANKFRNLTYTLRSSTLSRNCRFDGPKIGFSLLHHPRN